MMVRRKKRKESWWNEPIVEFTISKTTLKHVGLVVVLIFITIGISATLAFWVSTFVEEKLKEPLEPLSPTVAQREMTNENRIVFNLISAYEDKILNCSLNANIYFTSKQFEKARVKIIECRELISNALVEAGRLERNLTTSKNEIRAFKLSLNAGDNLLSAIYLVTLINTTTEEEMIQGIYQVEHSLRNSLFNIYQLKKEYFGTDYYRNYKDEIEESIKTIVNTHNEINQIVNTYYETKYDWKAKYFLQVNPNDPVIIDVTDNLIEGVTDRKQIEWAIFNFVRDGVQYKYDPNWITDWVQQPAITLIYGKGDCEDHAILLASMFMRAGIEKVQLCSADTDGDDEIDHMYVAVDKYAWDTTCKNCESSAPDEVKNWKSQCFDINEMIRSPPKKTCYDGTEYGKCSNTKPYYCDNGNLVMQCQVCGCPSDYPECRSDGVCYRTITIERTYTVTYKCPEGYVLGNDNLCHQACGSPNTYCPTGSYCCNNECVGCPAGYFLAVDCNCYPY